MYGMISVNKYVYTYLARGGKKNWIEILERKFEFDISSFCFFNFLPHVFLSSQMYSNAHILVT